MDLWVLILITVLLLGIIFGGNIILRRRYTKKIMLTMANEDMDGFFQIIDSFGCKMILRPGEREMMRLSAYLTQGKAKAIEEQLPIDAAYAFEEKRESICGCARILLLCGNKKSP